MPLESELSSPPPTSGASPDESPYYNRAFWAAYKGASRGKFGGLLLGAALGLAIGGVVTLGVLVFGGAGVFAGGLGIPTAIIGVFTAIGANYYRDEFGAVGAVAGSNAAVMEIAEQRSDVLNHKLDRLLAAQERKGALAPGEIDDIQKNVSLIRRRGDQMFEANFQSHRPIFWKVALIGAMAGALVGALALGGGYLLLGKTALDAVGLGGGTLLVPATAAAAMMGGASLAGATYGINRYYYRQLFNVTNALYEGDLRGYDKAKEQQALENQRPAPDFAQRTPSPEHRPEGTLYPSDLKRSFASGLVPVGSVARAAMREREVEAARAAAEGPKSHVEHAEKTSSQALGL